MGILFLYTYLSVTLFLIINAPPKVINPNSAIEQLTNLHTTISKIQFGKNVKPLLNEIKEQIPPEKCSQLQQKIKQTIREQLLSYEIKNNAKALRILNIPQESVVRFSKINKLPEKQRVQSFQTSVLDIIKEQIHRTSILAQAYGDAMLRSDLEYLSFSVSQIEFDDSLISLMTRIKDLSCVQYELFVNELKDLIKKSFEEQLEAGRQGRSCRVLAYLVISRAYFMQTLELYGKMIKNKEIDSKMFKVEFRKSLTELVNQQCENTMMDVQLLRNWGF